MTAARPNFTSAAWSKSSYSDDNNGNCVEVAVLPGWVGLRDSKDHGRGPVLAFTATEWAAFAAGVHDGEFPTP